MLAVSGKPFSTRHFPDFNALAVPASHACRPRITAYCSVRARRSIVAQAISLSIMAQIQ